MIAEFEAVIADTIANILVAQDTDVTVSDIHTQHRLFTLRSA